MRGQGLGDRIARRGVERRRGGGRGVITPSSRKESVVGDCYRIWVGKVGGTPAVSRTVSEHRSTGSQQKKRNGGHQEAFYKLLKRENEERKIGGPENTSP